MEKLTPENSTFQGTYKNLTGFVAALSISGFAFFGVTVFILEEHPSFLPWNWVYKWIGELFFLWFVPLLFLLWSIASTMIAERHSDVQKDTHEELKDM